MLGDIDFLEAAARVVRHHHERWDGRGYPDGLAGADIPLPARILGVIDAFQAVAWPATPNPTLGGSRRPSPRIRSRAGTQFDPDVVDALVSLFDESHWKSSPLATNRNRSSIRQGRCGPARGRVCGTPTPGVGSAVPRRSPPVPALLRPALGSTARGSGAGVYGDRRGADAGRSRAPGAESVHRLAASRHLARRREPRASDQGPLRAPSEGGCPSADPG